MNSPGVATANPPRFNEAGGILPPEWRAGYAAQRRLDEASMRPGGFSPRSVCAGRAAPPR